MWLSTQKTPRRKPLSEPRCGRGWQSEHPCGKTATDGRLGPPTPTLPPRRPTWTGVEQWQRELYDGGWAAIDWPVDHGGRGVTRGGNARSSSRRPPSFDVTSGFLAAGIALAGPAIGHFGTEEQKTRHLRPMLRGDVVWCQLFSEPGAGSDLANLGDQGRPGRGRVRGDTDRRCGTPRPIFRTGASCWPAPIPRPPSTRGSPSSWWTCTRPRSGAPPHSHHQRLGPLQRGVPERRADPGRQRGGRGQRGVGGGPAGVGQRVHHDRRGYGPGRQHRQPDRPGPAAGHGPGNR